MALIANTSDVSNRTGVSVSSETIRRAQAIINLACGCDIDNESVVGQLGARDHSRLILAVVYQAAWMDSHPEVFSTMDVAQIDQDDLNVTFREDPEAQLIAPLAQMAMSRLSWRKSGMASVSVRSAFQTRTVYENWKPIP